ncbi:MAG: (Na+)-NQR maturation NqrM [Planctomycetaceae bacterium]
MPEFLIAFAVFALAVAGMAIGVILNRKRLKGTCGGLANLRDERGNSLCDACTSPSPECRGENAATNREREGAASGATRLGSPADDDSVVDSESGRMTAR